MDGHGVGFAVCISTALANKLMISVRRHYYGHEANSADNKAATVAVDSLINFEAVKVSSDIPTCVIYH